MKCSISASFVAGAALAIAALVTLDYAGDTGGGIGAVNGGSAVEEDLDAIDDADWDLFGVTYQDIRSDDAR